MEIQGYSTGLMMSQLQEGIAVCVEIPFCKRIPKRLALYLFPGCPHNDFTLGPTFQRSIASHHYAEDQGLPTRAPPGETKGSYLKRAATFSAKEPNGAVLHTGMNSGGPVVVTSD